jgi:large subunit ribosomal protein L35e
LADSHWKPSELKTKNRAGLLDELGKLKRKLFELRGQIGSSASAEKLSAVRTIRKDVACVKIILMEQKRIALTIKFTGTKFVPIDIQPHAIKAERTALPPK